MVGHKDNTLVIFGSRDLHPRPRRLNQLMWSHDVQFDKVISGGARGVDTAAKHFAHVYAYPFEEYPADWIGLGRKAGMIRNQEMADAATHGVCVWDGESVGTKAMLDMMVKQGKPVVVYIDRG